jgi:hypothetical protein
MCGVIEKIKESEKEKRRKGKIIIPKKFKNIIYIYIYINNSFLKI